MMSHRNKVQILTGATCVVVVIICVLMYIATTVHRTVVRKNGIVISSYGENGAISYIATQPGFGMKAAFVIDGREVSPRGIMESLSVFMKACGNEQVDALQYNHCDWTFTKTKNGDVDWFGCKLEYNMTIRYNGVTISHGDSIEDVILRLGALKSDITRDSDNVIIRYFCN